MKFGQLIEYNMRKTFLEKSYTECDGEASDRLFYKKGKLSISLDQQYQMSQSLFFVSPCRSLPKYIKTKVLTTCLYLY